MADTRKENTNFYYWLNIVELLSDNSPVFIVKNVRDQRVPKIDEPSLKARFANLEPSLACDLATDPDALQGIRDFIQYRVQQLPQVGNRLPKSWLAVREALEADARNTLDVKDYYAVCAAQGIAEREHQQQVSGYLHDVGVCLHFQDDPLLRKTLILKPEWGTEAVYKVVFDACVQQQQGWFSYTDIQRVWCDAQYSDMHSELLQLMKNFKLCYELPEGKQYIAPRLLAEERPAFDWDNHENLILRYAYVFMPKGILHQLIVQLHGFIEDQQRRVWQYGVVFSQTSGNALTRALVTEDYNQRQIEVRIHGRHKRDFLTIIDHELQKIHDAFHRFKYEKWIPCQCETFVNDPEFFELTELKEFAEDGAKIQCRKRGCRQMLDARLVLEGVGMTEQTGRTRRVEVESISRGAALKKLQAISAVEFEEVLFLYEPPEEYLSGKDLPRTTRAIELLNYAKQQDGNYARLMEIVDTVLDKLR